MALSIFNATTIGFIYSKRREWRYSSGSSWAPDDYTPVDVGLRSTFLFLFFSMCTILSGQSNLHRRDNEATRYKIYIKGRNPKLTGTIRLVDHGLNDSTPGVDKPGGEKRKKFLQLLTRL
jgi:hypothetical protein